jgi:hypothetical protein
MSFFNDAIFGLSYDDLKFPINSDGTSANPDSNLVTSTAKKRLNLTPPLEDCKKPKLSSEQAKENDLTHLIPDSSKPKEKQRSSIPSKDSTTNLPLNPSKAKEEKTDSTPATSYPQYLLYDDMKYPLNND